VTDRPLNDYGISSETIAAEYETDAALTEAGSDLKDPYFAAAWAAECEQRDIDRATVQAADEGSGQ
jgi:hypothetical protein